MSHALSCFLSVLNAKIQNIMRMFIPKTLHDAYCLAKLQEATLASIARKKPTHSQTMTPHYRPRFSATSHNNPSYRSYSRPTFSSHNSQSSSYGSPSLRFKKSGRSFTTQELDERRAKSLCFYCDEKYILGHKCKAQMYKIELNSHEEEGQMAEEEEELEVEEPSGFSEETPHISLSALVGLNTYQTMGVMEKVKKNSLYILIDSGSTHNFLDVTTAKRLSCDVRNIVPLQIFVANGQKLVSSAIC